MLCKNCSGVANDQYVTCPSSLASGDQIFALLIFLIISLVKMVIYVKTYKIAILKKIIMMFKISTGSLGMTNKATVSICNKTFEISTIGMLPLCQP